MESALAAESVLLRWTTNGEGMMKRVFAVAVLATALFVGAIAQPAPAVVHEIYAAWCAGKGEIEPPGISRDGSKNFASPVLKSGAVSVHPIPAGTQGPAGILIDIDFDRPNVKLIPTGQIITIGQTPDGPLYLEAFMIDPNFPAFASCANLELP
jgi:hypothetical protein